MKEKAVFNDLNDKSKFQTCHLYIKHSGEAMKWGQLTGWGYQALFLINKHFSLPDGNERKSITLLYISHVAGISESGSKIS